MSTQTTDPKGYSIESAASVMLITFMDSHQDWKVSDLVQKVRRQNHRFGEVDLILNMEHLSEFEGPIIKTIWQLSRLQHVQGRTMKCVLPPEKDFPALEIFVVNGIIDRYDSLEAIIYEDDPLDARFSQTLEFCV